MTVMNARLSDAIYDDATDVMYIPLGNSRFTDEEEVAPGVHVLYAFEGSRLDKVVAVEIEDYASRYGSGSVVIDIPSVNPFSLSLA